MPAHSDIRDLVDSFTSDLSKIIQRASLEEMQAKLQAVLGDVAPTRRGPGRPRKTATAAVPQRKKRGKRNAADLSEMGDALLAHVKANPGKRGDQIAAALRTDVGTMRLPMKKLIAERKVRTEGQRRGMTYFAGAGKAKGKGKHAAGKTKRSRPARRAKSGKGRKPATLIPRAGSTRKVVEQAVVPTRVPATVA